MMQSPERTSPASATASPTAGGNHAAEDAETGAANLGTSDCPLEVF